MTGDVLAILADPRPDTPFDRLEHVRDGRFVAIYAARRMLPRMGRKAAARAAFERQSALEQLMRFGTVLPALPGTNLHPGDVARTLQTHQDKLDELTGKLRGRVQFQLQIRYDEAAAETWLPPGQDPTDIRMKEAMATRAHAALRDLDPQSLDLPLAPGLALNRALLIGGDQEAMLDSAVEQIDAAWTEGLAIRLVGPSPAVSFMSFGLKRVSAAQVSQACAALGLDGATGNVRTAYRAAVMAAPHEASALRRAAEIATAAQSAEAGVAPLHLLYTWSEGQSSVEPVAERDVA